MTNRSGSEKRFRRHLVGFRATPEEKRGIAAAAAYSRLSVAAFCRRAVVEHAQAQAQEQLRLIEQLKVMRAGVPGGQVDKP